MARSGYSDDCDGWALIRWRGAVASSIRGKRGQAFLRELADAMDAMPSKVLISGDLKDAEGDFCALGVVGQARGADLAGVDIEDRQAVAALLNIPEALAAEIMFENDDDFAYGWRNDTTPQQRWGRMREWVRARIVAAPTEAQ
jgi:hypothetical protein